METSMNYNRMTTIFFISGIIVMASLYTALPLTSVFAKDFGISNAVASLNGVIFSITYSLSCLFYGTISEKFGRIRTILFGLIGLVIICLLIGFIHSFTLLIILRAIQGICAAAFSPVSITYVTETYSPVKRVTAISFISTSFMLSGVIGQNLSEIVVRYSNWHMVYFILTLLYIFIAVLIYKYIPESPVKNPQLKLVGFFKNFKDFKGNKIVILCYLISLSLLTMFISMYTIFNHYITSDIVGGSEATAINAKLFGIIGMLLSLLAGRMSERIGVKQVIVGALIVSIVSLILMGFTTNVILLVIWSVIFVGGIAFAIPSTISKVGMVVNRNQGFFLSVNTFILFLGTAIAPLLMILIQPLSNFTLQFIMIAVIGIIALIVALLLPRRKNVIR
ncbi:MFS transporter [Staphylococcus hominis]|uniref:MFS transporter n=1 Tax=Staphylococcus hominis TaxID=1290 RepID=UPI000E69F7D6|nr:MFS transporter [Staphylococcus hominis]RIO51893.1 MFS transporter [Staphylococcus hominis]